MAKKYKQSLRRKGVRKTAKRSVKIPGGTLQITLKKDNRKKRKGGKGGKKKH